MMARRPHAAGEHSASMLRYLAYRFHFIICLRLSEIRVKSFCKRLAILLMSLAAGAASAQSQRPLEFGVGLFQPDKEKNDATYKPLADYLARKLCRPVRLRTVDTWEGLAKSLASSETDLALMGPWGYVLANNQADAHT